MVRIDTQVFRRYILNILLTCGLIAGHTAVVHATSPFTPHEVYVERLFDHEQIRIPYIENTHIHEEVLEDAPTHLNTVKVPRRRKYILNTASQLTSYTTRFLQLQLNTEFYIPVQENKTGVYQQQHAFLPAYYSFLSRYTPF